MKYMTFNNSCSYAGIANLLEDYDIDIQDYQLAIELKVPYIFKYDEDGGKCYISGSYIQTDKDFNYYLHKKDLKLNENFIDKSNLISFFDNLKHKSMTGLHVFNDDGKHAVIYIGKENDEYVFMNNRRENSNETEYFRFNSDELKRRADEITAISYIEKGIDDNVVNIDKEIKNSLMYLESYRKEVTEFCQKEQSIESLNRAMSELFHGLFLDVYSMMVIINEKKIANDIAKIRTDYLKAMKLKKTLKLIDYISIDELNNIIDEYKELIQTQIK